MIHKKNFVQIFCILNTLLISPSTLCNTLSFISVKPYLGAGISPSFFKSMIDLFHMDTFVETGTYLGESTENALAYFEAIHTIELSQNLFARAERKFRNQKHVHLYLGDSAEILPTLLPTINGKMFLWLDAHYSGGITTGEGKDPLLEEIAAIKTSNISDAVIFIDDIRGWQEQAYKIRDAVLAIRPDYQFVIFGDVAIAFAPEENVIPSPVIQAMTISRLYPEDPEFIKDIFAAEKIIGQASAIERDTIMNIPFQGYCSLWRGLIYLHEKQFSAAKKEFETAQTTYCNLPRIQTYIQYAQENIDF